MSKKTNNRSTEQLEDFPDRVPLLPMGSYSVFPGTLFPVHIAGEQSIEVIEYAREEALPVVLIPVEPNEFYEQKKPALPKVAMVAEFAHLLQSPAGDYKVRFHVTGRVQISKSSLDQGVRMAHVEFFEEPVEVILDDDQSQLLEGVKSKFSLLFEQDDAGNEYSTILDEFFEPGLLADYIASVLDLSFSEGQRLVEERDPFKRLAILDGLLENEVAALAVRQKIERGANARMTKSDREHILREQLRQIREELGEADDPDTDISELRERLKKMRMPAHARKEAEKQLRRLGHLHGDSAEAALARTYLDWILDLPWSKKTKDKLDILKAREILDKEHYGLEETKERILDFLGVKKLKKGIRGPILLFVGPPGVGKTSLGKSIANALGRKFVRMSLGGLRDEAELRGHRRTYVGALPGRVIQSLKTAGSCNPVFMLDELDKVGSDFRGDPASVLLEVLDPEQNKEFHDHYLNVPFNLSEVMFIGTANQTDTIPPALLDRMEVIEINGYTLEEKVEIAKRYLIPEEKQENGLEGQEISFTDKAISALISGYTRESGVRELRRRLGTVLRKLARQLAEEKAPPKMITPDISEELLGPVKYLEERQLGSDQVGVVTGLAVTSVGGEIMRAEVSLTRGKGQLNLTGQLGDVMRESAMAALTYVLSNAKALGVDPNFFDKSNLHVHLPQGAVPKDGPSAGIAITTALVSLLTDRPISRDIAMTGEVTLRGNVLAIGGLREKCLAALRAGITTVVIPKENERELVKFPKHLREKLKVVAVETVDEVLELALLPSEKSKRRGSILRI